MQIGNCGSPIETEAGWLLLTHGVGPMRRYCIGATLLDLDDPCRVIGQTREPLIMPTDEERTGYVPNVVYSCGALLHKRMLIIPYALTDLSTSMARIDLDELLQSLVETVTRPCDGDSSFSEIDQPVAALADHSGRSRQAQAVRDALGKRERAIELRRKIMRGERLPVMCKLAGKSAHRSPAWTSEVVSWISPRQRSTTR